MAKKIATDEAVAAAAKALLQQGIEPTTLLIQERIGGSLTTIGPALDRWRTKQATLRESEPAPADITEKADQFVRVLWSLARQQAEVAVQEVRRLADAAAEVRAGELKHAHAEMLRLEQEGSRLEEQLSDARRALELAHGHVQAQARRLEQLEAECARANGALVEARAEGQQHLVRAASLEGERAGLKTQLADLLAVIGRSTGAGKNAKS